jgi:hypothetical protein
MKKLTLIFTLLVSTVMLSSPSYAKWTKVGEGGSGNTYYVDYERIRKHDGYIYFWELEDLLKPDSGYLSIKIYKQGDCKLFRVKNLSFSFYKEPMGRVTGESFTPPDKWKYPAPNTKGELVLKSVCSR